MKIKILVKCYVNLMPQLIRELLSMKKDSFFFYCYPNLVFV